ncbi:hypothetical protein ABPG75_003136 [Micractinium tetrahymenae]
MQVVTSAEAAADAAPADADSACRPLRFGWFEVLLRSACAVAHHCPGLVGPGFLDPALRALAALPEPDRGGALLVGGGEGAAAARIALLTSVGAAEGGGPQPRLFAQLAASGPLAAALNEGFKPQLCRDQGVLSFEFPHFWELPEQQAQARLQLFIDA